MQKNDIKLYGITGSIGSGKNSFGSFFIENGFISLSYAKRLKDVLSVMFDWDRDMLEGITQEHRLERNIPDEFWSDVLGEYITPRSMMQRIGTDLVRDHFSEQFWINTVKQDMDKLIEQGHTKFVITDCRFKNEIDFVHDNGGEIFEIQKGVLPDYYEYSATYNNRGKHTYMIDPYKKFGVHESEWAWIGVNNPDYIIKNDSTLEALREQALKFM